MTEKKWSFKRLLSTMLVLCMVASFIPVASATEGTSGVYVKYDFENYVSYTGTETNTVNGEDLGTISYSNSKGRMEFYGTDKTESVGSAKYYGGDKIKNAAAAITLTEGKYAAFKIKVPKHTKYAVKVTYVSRNAGPIMGINFLAETDVKNESKYSDESRRFIELNTSTAPESSNKGMLVTMKSENILDTTVGSDSRYAGADEVYLSIARIGAGGGATFYLNSIELCEINPETNEVYADLKAIPVYGNVTSERTTLTNEEPETELSLSGAYMSDGIKANAEDILNIRYVSSNDSIVTIEGSKAIGKSKGKVTVSAYSCDLYIGSIEISSEVVLESGVYVKYDFEKYADATALQEIDYTDSTGRMEYYGGTSDTSADTVKTYEDTYGTYKAAAINITEVGKGYIAYKIKVPKNAKYVVKATYAWRNDGPTMGINILTQSDIALAESGDATHQAKFYDPSRQFMTLNTSSSANSGLTKGTPVTVTAETILDTTVGSESRYAGADELYLSIARIKSGNNASLYLKSIELCEINLETGSAYTELKAAPIYGEVSFGETVYLENKNDTAIVSIANKYLSDGTGGTFDVTYVSSDESVATVFGSTITAKGAGTATIYAYSGDFAVGSKDIDVAATNEDGNPTKAEDGTPEIVSQSVKMLTTVLGEELASTSVSETVAIVDGYATVTADAKDKKGNTFLYWAKGLQSGAGKKVLSTVRENYKFKPSNGVNYIIAVYGKPSDEYTPKYFNANGQPLADGNTLPSMPGFGTAKGFKDCGFGVHIAEYDPADEVTYTITENNHGTVNTYSKEFGDEISVTANDASAGEYFRFWKKKAADGSVEIVSFDKEYTFYAFENCEVTAVYSAYESATSQGTLAANFRKIILTNLGGNQYMAEFIGFSDAVEKGIAIGTNRIAMTTDKTQFTLDAETTEGVNGYAIGSDGKVYYAD